ncbi:sugar-binding transcriptional regulator [Bombilactobacillus folatiphilus]|uniref:Sugar-binding transcriptional regulator n=1 Tax=Bombilactobacillus folatiphilus TaxID=2923362 RepID=A0ABY4P801_9LACO|nr:sugar-binding transcriptional regulator [Bombilactobacillus folatiphilus]UQS81767.1 sugar-binding transcriptional regulator [Bombilactobacillus folatiphilus]
MKPTDKTKLKQALTVAQLYYEENLSQAAIAQKMGLSRPTISRLLQLAKESGLVKIQIENPFLNDADLTDILSQKYQAQIHVVAPHFAGQTTNLDSVGAYAANFLTNLVKPNDIIGIGWGKTIHAMTQNLTEQIVPGVQTVQLKGGFSFSHEKTFSYESINELAQAFHTQAQYLPLPTIFDSQVTKDLVEQDRFIKQILDLGKQANIALFSVGTVRSNSLLFNLGYLTQQQKSALQAKAVGDIVSRFIDSEGQIIDQELNQRTVGIEASDLKQKQTSIVIASGLQKAAAVHAVLKAHYANFAILDTALAQSLINYE